MATVDFHQFNCTLRRLNEKQLEKVIRHLGLQRSQFAEARNYRTKDLLSLTFAFPLERCSVYIKIGRLQDPLNNDGWNSHIKIYHNCRIEIHGNFFDRSPSFKLPRLVRYLEEIECHSPTQLDIGFMDTDEVTTWDDWERVATNWRGHFTGSLLLKGGVKKVVDGTTTDKIYIGNTSSKTAHAVVYRRDNGQIRLEIRYRDRDTIIGLLEWYCLEWEGHAEKGDGDDCAREFLLDYMDIVTADSRAEVKRTGRAAAYVREAFFARFIVAPPFKGRKKALRKVRKQELAGSYHRSAQMLAGRLNNFVARWSQPPEDVAEVFNQYLNGFTLCVNPKPAAVT